MEFPGLYFPFINVRDEEWLKRSALYWPSIARLRPRGYPIRSTPTDAVFREAGVLKDIDPKALLSETNWDLIESLDERLPELASRYGVSQARVAQVAEWASSDDPRNWEWPGLAWIHVSNVPHDLLQRLEDARVAISGRHLDVRRPGETGSPRDWLGMHPALAGAYMTALASQLSLRGGFSAITDQQDLRQATPAPEVSEALELLLGRAVGASRDDPTATYVMMAFECVQPAISRPLSAEDVLRIRRELKGELQTSRDYVAEQRSELAAIAGVADSRQVELFAEHVQQTIKIPLDRLERSLRLLSFETTRSIAMTSTLAPPAAVAPGLVATGSPIAITVGGVAAILGGAWWSRKSGKRDKISTSPVGYLMDVRAAITPKTLASQAMHLFV